GAQRRFLVEQLLSRPVHAAARCEYEPPDAEAAGGPGDGSRCLEVDLARELCVERARGVSDESTEVHDRICVARRANDRLDVAEIATHHLDPGVIAQVPDALLP